jgi:regulator of replication initiation timing
MIKQIAAEKELADMYEELKIVENVADLGKNVKKLETMVRKGPDNPKGIMSAKNYREKIVIPFIDKMYDAFKNVVKFAKGCFAQLKELTEKYNEQLEVNEMLRKQNSRLRESIDEQEKEIDGLYDDRKKLGYFKNFLRREDYNKVIEMGKNNEKTRHRQR